MLTVNVDQNTNVNAYGGGVNFDSVASTGPTWLVSGSSITGNRTISSAAVVKTGGGFNLFADAHNVSFVNTTISGNNSASEGGGIFVRHTNGGAIAFSGSTISSNTAASRGGGLSNNNLAGANLEQALATEKQAVNARFASDISIKQDRLKQLRDELNQVK